MVELGKLDETLTAHNDVIFAYKLQNSIIIKSGKPLFWHQVCSDWRQEIHT